MQIPCLLMYELLHSIRHAGPLQSTVSLGTPEDRCKFWQRSMAEGRATARDLTIPRSQWHELVPCFFHMDGAEFYRNSEFLVWSWCAATSEATNIWDFKFVYTMLPSLLCHVKSVFSKVNEAVAKLVGWDFGVCQSGRGA